MKDKNVVIGLGLFLVILVGSVGCNSKSSETRQELDKTEINTQQDIEVIAGIDPSQLLTSVCYVCHNPKSGSHDEMLAPPLVGIKQQYLRATEDRDGFIERMVAFVSNPNEESAIMKGPIRRFGLMPKPAVNEEEIKAIVEFIYDNELPEPTWFAEHEEEMHGKDQN